MKDLRSKFLKVYANVPLGIRNDIISVIDGEPMTWRVCYLEIHAETKWGDKILAYLDEMRFI